MKAVNILLALACLLVAAHAIQTSVADEPSLPEPGFAQGEGEGEGGAPAPAGGDDAGGRPVGFCDVCRYVIENKQRRQPYLCRGLTDTNYQKFCVRTLESMMWWLNNMVYWNNYGCQRDANGVKEWVRPCPSSAICSWIQDFETKMTFCVPDKDYPKPE
jgi:hypothetical protein